ncbi:MAG: hypothetical protein ACRD0G_02815 [Acidimicrobiales bacterium]
MLRWLTMRWLRRRWAAADVLLNPSASTLEIDELIRALPGVERVTTHSGFLVTNDDGEPRPRYEVEGDTSADFLVLVFGSHDGGYLEMNRPAVHEGRLPTGDNEAVLNVAAAAESGYSVGDVVPLAFWRPYVQTEGVDATDEEAAAAFAEIIEPEGVEEVTIVGIVTLHDEVLADDLYPRGRVIVSADIAAQYECPAPPTLALTATSEAAYEAFVPPGCASTYRYYALEFEDGAAGVAAALETFGRASQVLADDLLGDESQFGFFIIPTETDEHAQRVERAVRPTVTALTVLGVAAAGVTTGLAGLALARELRRTQPDRRQLYELGVGPSLTATVAVLPASLAALAGASAGALVGWLIDFGPVGLVSAVEPHPARRLSEWALLGAGGLVVAGLLTIATLAWRAARRSGRVAGAPRGCQQWPVSPELLRRMSWLECAPPSRHGLPRRWSPPSACRVVRSSLPPCSPPAWRRSSARHRRTAGRGTLRRSRTSATTVPIRPTPSGCSPTIQTSSRGRSSVSSTTSPSTMNR